MHRITQIHIGGPSQILNNETNKVLGVGVHLHLKTFVLNYIESFQMANSSLSKFINALAYKLLELCHDMHIACDEQITPLYSLRSRHLSTCRKSTRIKKS